MKKRQNQLVLLLVLLLLFWWWKTTSKKRVNQCGGSCGGMSPYGNECAEGCYCDMTDVPINLPDATGVCRLIEN